MKKWKRSRPIRQVVIHTNEGPETPVTSAESLARYLDSIVGGYHHVHDDDSTVTLARDDQCVAGAKGGDCNEVAVHHCIIGRADQSAAQWADAFSKAAVGRCAKSVASYCLAYGIAADHIVGSGIRLPAKSGICGHGDVSAAWNVKGGHTDPGPAFPWAQFLDLVRAYMTTAPVPLPSYPTHDVQEDSVKTKLVTVALDQAGNGWTNWDPGLARDPVIVGVTFNGPYPPVDGYPFKTVPLAAAQARGGEAIVSVMHGEPLTTVAVFVSVA